MSRRRHQRAIVLCEAGFSHVRRSTETPFSIILEARPQPLHRSLLA